MVKHWRQDIDVDDHNILYDREKSRAPMVANVGRK